jgi:crossover junction endodeoxyribonuclease RuvC
MSSKAIEAEPEAIAPVLGLDPGIATVGYGLVHGDAEGLVAISYGVLTTPATLPTSERLKLLYDGLNELIERYQPAEVAVELFIARNLRAALVVGQARGVALLAAANHNLPVYEYTPLEVKRQVSGYGRGNKRQVQEMVRLRLNLDALPQPDDAADALAIAICHIQQSRLRGLIDKRR